MKKIFRYLTGELTSGFYTSALYNTMNVFIKDIEEFLSHIKRTQFVLQSDKDFTSDMDEISESTLYGLCVFSGLFRPRVQADVFKGSLRFVSPDSGAEKNERGLVVRDTDTFKFIRQEMENYTSDIVTDADNDNQASFVPSDAPVLGFIKMSDEDVIDYTTGLVSDDFIENRMTPPEQEEEIDEPYFPFYGNKYLHTAEAITVVAPLSVEILKALFEACQQIRYNGANLKSLLSIIESLFGTEYLKITEYVNKGKYKELHYTLNDDYLPSDHLARLGVLDLLLNYKFKQLILVEE